MREPKQDRSAATRARVLEAAVATLLELGYARTTAALVADRAGVSRGAMQYHFPTKSDLVAATVEHLVVRLSVDLRRAAGRLPDPSRARVDAVIDLLWKTSSAPLAILWLELNVAARTDPHLEGVLAGLRRDFSARLQRESVALFGGDPDDPQVRMFVEMSLAMLTGLLVARLTLAGSGSRSRREAQLIAAWKAAAPAVLRQPAPTVHALNE